MTPTREQRTQFDYLLNAVDAAAQHENPAAHGYAEKRQALFAYVRGLENRAALATPPPADLAAQVETLTREKQAAEQRHAALVAVVKRVQDKRCRMSPLPDVMVCDTKTHLIRSKGLSLSQESLGAMFRLDAQKVSMNQIKWRAANRLTAAGLAEVRKRVVGDVRQHIQLRKELLAAGYLAAPKKWSSGAAKIEAYTP